MPIDALLGRARSAAEALMVDACTIARIGGRVTDTTTGEVTEPVTTLYTGKCRVQQAQAQAQREDAGEDRLLMLRLEVQLPMSVEGLEVGDIVTITASVHDPDLPGRVFRIHDLAHKTHATARRVQCLEVTGS
jgi:hypothetical protein